METGTLGVHAGVTAISTSTTDFDEFYRSHRADAVRWATALVGSPEIGEELAQDSLAAVGRRLSTLDNPAALPAAHGGEPRRVVASLAHPWRCGVKRVSSQGSRRRTRKPTGEMLAALASLPYKQRAAVSLRYWADWTDDQIAEALECAPSSVRVLLHRGLAALKKEIAE